MKDLWAQALADEAAAPFVATLRDCLERLAAALDLLHPIGSDDPVVQRANRIAATLYGRNPQGHAPQ